jgi:hypothetical protein
MGAKEKLFSQIIKNEFGDGIKPKLDSNLLVQSKLYPEIIRVYKSLGGILPNPPLKLGNWDIIASDFIIELDEENHFNRYRGITLNSNFYNQSNIFSVNDYKSYCKRYESKCVSYGKYWKNDSTEKQFGISNVERNLNDNGSSRWKQRAYYDYLKDIASVVYNLPIYRVSIYDNYKGVLIEKILKSEDSSSLKRFIKEKVV